MKNAFQSKLGPILVIVASLLILSSIFIAQAEANSSNKATATAWKAPDNIVIDGNLSEWNTSSPIVIDNMDQLIRERSQWQNASDFSAKVYLMWDESNLYVGGEVKDDLPFTAQVSQSLNIVDGIGIFLSTNPDADSTREAYKSTDFNAYIALENDYFDSGIDRRAVENKEGFKTTGMFYSVKPWHVLDNEKTAMGGSEEYTYTFEAKMSFTSFTNENLPLLSPEKGTEIGFDLVFADRDSGCPSGRSCALAWTGDNTVYEDPSQWGTLTFDSEEVSIEPPVSSFSYSPSSPTVDNTIQFTDNSNDSDGSIESWLWQFGDETTSKVSNPTHSYENAGTYVVTLTVTDDAGNQDVSSKVIEVKGLKDPWFVNEDNKVGLSDLMTVSYHYGESESSPGWLPAADADGNGSIGLQDLMTVAYHYGESWEWQHKAMYTAVNKQGLNLMNKSDFLAPSTEGVMLMIEFHENTLGLTNFVHMLNKRDIPGLLACSPNYITDHCETIKKVRKAGVKLAVGINAYPFWNKPYKEQYEAMKEAKEAVENCIGEEPDLFNSRYFAYDENTIKAADELGIDYILARGTTGKRATVYKPEEYDVKILSVSNMSSPEYGTGSLCDYSYWARGGTPEEFENKLFDALEYDQISPVSHTYIGGMEKRWDEAYIEFLDNSNVEWESFEEFVKEPDLVLPFSEIPQNREVQYRVEKPNVTLEEGKNVSNPCAAGELITEPSERENLVVMFHNNRGRMCLEAKMFFLENSIPYREYLTGFSENFHSKLNEYKQGFSKSEGVSESFGVYPIIFIGDNKAYSGFNENVKQGISNQLEKMGYRR